MRCPEHDWELIDDDSEAGCHMECRDCDAVYVPYIGTMPLDLSPFGYLSDEVAVPAGAVTAPVDSSPTYGLNDWEW